MPRVGLCGEVNGTAVGLLTRNSPGLCASPGAAARFAGLGPWTWTCPGQNGGASAACQAASSVSLATRITAAQTTAQNTSTSSACGAIHDDGFYWEIGDENGVIADGALTASGSVPPAFGLPVARTTAMPIASASKWLYGIYATERLASSTNGTWRVPSAVAPFLNFTSGYDNMTGLCPNKATNTVNDCLAALNVNGFPNGTRSPGHVGYFQYDSGHFEVLEGGGDPSIAGVLNGSTNTAAQVGLNLSNVLGAHGITTGIVYTSVLLAGAGRAAAEDYAPVLRALIRTEDPLVMSHFLRPPSEDPYAVCTSTVDPTCVDDQGNPASYGTPVPSNLSWHYSLGHWIESDPVVGDGTYSSAGAFGFYPWIDVTRTFYGILARQGAPGTGQDSAACGATIRKAYMTGVPQN